MFHHAHLLCWDEVSLTGSSPWAGLIWQSSQSLPPVQLGSQAWATESSFIGFFLQLCSPVYVAQSGLDVEILLLQHPKCWDYSMGCHAWKIITFK
jgi:hypothetical protein